VEQARGRVAFGDRRHARNLDGSISSRQSIFALLNEKPTHLPVRQFASFELMINQRYSPAPSMRANEGRVRYFRNPVVSVDLSAGANRSAKVAGRASRAAASEAEISE
jgi:hypothetical protein